MRGQLVTPEDPDYDAARAVFNAMVDKRPAGVIHVAQVSDVIAGVNFARESSMPLAIRGRRAQRSWFRDVGRRSGVGLR
ncbi:hypothetical protein [Paenarthrobacter sp. CAP02]|uniref:hypothetical protein n=1 Tax=Paenarthrobacter sp. CAP02 TaxID=3158144 RepID=UPI0032DA03A9